MKKIISILVLAAMLVSAFCLSIPSGAAARTYGYKAGDVNDDGRITVKDVVALKRYLASAYSDRDICVKSADCNVDSAVNAQDVSLLKDYLVCSADLVGNNTNHKYKVTELKLGGKNVSRFTIVKPRVDASDPNQSMSYAATVLKDKIKKACNLTLNIAYADSNVAGYKIILRYDDNNAYALGDEGFNFSFNNEGDFVITCGAKRGCLYGVYEFLERFCGFVYLTGTRYDQTEYQNEILLSDVPADINETQVPGFEYRGVTGGGIANATSGDRSRDNFLPLRVNSSEDGGAYSAYKGDYVHDYGGAVGTTYLHAHSFAYYEAGWGNTSGVDSIGGGVQSCMTDPAFREKCLDFMKKTVTLRDQIPGYQYTQVSCSPNDNGNFCTCSRCKAVYQAEGATSGALIRLVNSLASDSFFTVEHPELEVFTCAYAGLQVPPQTAPLPNVCVCYCIVGCNNHNIRSTTCAGNPRLALNVPGGERNQPYINWLQGWLNLTPNVYFWYYTVNWSYYVSPSPNLYNFWDDIRYLKELGVKGLYMEGNRDTINNSFEFLRMYLICKMMWNPDMTYDQYIGYMNTYLEKYYGPGWQYIKQYIDMAMAAGDANGCWTDNFDWPWDMYNKSYFANNYETMVGLFEAAKSATNDQTYIDRIEKTSVHMHFLGLSATFYTNSGTQTWRDRYTWLWNYYNDHPGFRALSTWISDGQMNNYPGSPNEIRDTMSWLFSDYDGKR